MNAMIGEHSLQNITFWNFNVSKIEQDVNIADFISFITVKKQENNMEDKTVFARD